MNAQHPKDTVFRGGTQRLLPGQALRLPRRGGELTVLRGRLWLTRGKDPGDHFLMAGQRVRLGDHENAVIEPAESTRGVSLYWEPRRPALMGALLARPLSGAAFLAFLAARGFASLARGAAAAARRARGQQPVSDGYAVFAAPGSGRPGEPGRRC